MKGDISLEFNVLYWLCNKYFVYTHWTSFPWILMIRKTFSVILQQMKLIRTCFHWIIIKPLKNLIGFSFKRTSTKSICHYSQTSVISACRRKVKSQIKTLNIIALCIGPCVTSKSISYHSLSILTLHFLSLRYSYMNFKELLPKR